MKKIMLLIASVFVFFVSCKKETHTAANASAQLYPLGRGNVWIYIDSFFDDNGIYYGKDTFALKVAKTINFGGHTYTPITDQYDDSIFTLRSDDSSVFLLESPAELLVFQWPLDGSQTAIVNSYAGSLYTSAIFTGRIISTNFPSYRIVVTHDDGLSLDFRQQEMYFTPGKGIIAGQDLWKTSTGMIYTSDAYHLFAYSIH
jgi:hypothetical protein